MLCTIDPPWQRVASVFNALDTVLTFVVPVVVIVVLNTCISRTIWQLGSVRKRLTQRNIPQGSNYSRKVVAKNRPRINLISQNKMTKMLLVVSTACMCMNLPSYVMRVLTYLIDVSRILYNTFLICVPVHRKNSQKKLSLYRLMRRCTDVICPT